MAACVQMLLQALSHHHSPVRSQAQIFFLTMMALICFRFLAQLLHLRGDMEGRADELSSLHSFEHTMEFVGLVTVQ